MIAVKWSGQSFDLSLLAYACPNLRKPPGISLDFLRDDYRSDSDSLSKVLTIAQIEDCPMLIARLTLSGLTLFATLLVTACTSPSAAPPETEAPATETVETEADEPATPTDEPTATEPANSPAEAAPSTVTRTGAFASAEHETTGNVTLTSDNGQQTLVFDGTFATSDGPDLVVVLHRSANVIAESEPPAYPLNEVDYVVVAPLTAISGTQEYVVPAEIDLSAFESVAIWCQAFNATFGAAPLQ